MVRITILNDNSPGRGFLAEHGLSYFIETDCGNFLLDVGSSDVFLKNAEKLKINLSTIDYVILSHGHWDHGDGLDNLNNLKLVAHPNIFLKRYHADRNHTYVGLKFSKNDLEKHFELTLTSKPKKLCDSVWFLGEIPRVSAFESKHTAFVDSDGNPDYILDDSALAIKTPEGLIVISGCAHSGIINTINYAKKVTGEDNVKAVMGGFHLKKDDDITSQTVDSIKRMNISHVHPAHCTQLPALLKFFNAFKMNQISTGDVLTY